MGDGQNTIHGLRLCTDSYKLSEVVKLMNVLIIKYRIDCSMHFLEGKPRIYIPVKYISLLSSIVKPHMSKDMFYKLESGNSQNNVKKNNSSVVNLDSIIKVKKLSPSSYSYAQKRTFSTISINKSITPAPEIRPSTHCVLRAKSVFSSYLAGLFDAKGHISISKPDAKVKNLSLSITFNIKDLPLAERLKEVTGYG